MQGKILFAKVFNLILGGTELFPVGYDSFGNCVFYRSEEDAKAKRIDTSFDIKFFGNQMLGSGDRVLRMIGNLS